MSNGIEEVISTLYEMVQDAWSLPLGADKCVLERDKVLDLLDEINNQLPGEFKQAKTIVDARNEVITNAKREAESIQKQAEQKARQLVSEQRITQQAQAEAERLLSETKAQAEEVVRNTPEKLKELKAVTSPIPLMNVIRRILEYYFLQICGYDGSQLRKTILEENKPDYTKDKDVNEDYTKFDLATSMLSYIAATTYGVNDGLHYVDDVIDIDQCRDTFQMIVHHMGQDQHFNMMMGIR